MECGFFLMTVLLNLNDYFVPGDIKILRNMNMSVL